MDAPTTQPGPEDPDQPVEIERNDFISAEALLKGCPLTINIEQSLAKKSSGLGNLDKLPTEVQHNIFRHLDVQSFLVCRRVSRKALAVTGTVQEFAKIMRCEDTANAIRLAVGIDTAHYFTIAELFSKLCQKSCDNYLLGKACGKVAPYIDVFSCSRRCVKCAAKAFTTFEGLQTHGFDAAFIASLSSFRVIHKADSPYTLRNGQICTRVYELTKAMLWRPLDSEPEWTKSFEVFSARTFARFTVLITPFLDRKSMGTFGVISCHHCTPKKQPEPSHNRWGVPYRVPACPGSQPNMYCIPDHDLAYMCIDEYPAHLKEVHGIDYAT